MKKQRKRKTSAVAGSDSAPATQTATTAKDPAETAASPGQPSTEERQAMIATAAYLRAQQRGFIGGDPVQDWLAAEAEVNKMLDERSWSKRRQELEAYQMARQQLVELLSQVKAQFDADMMDVAFETAMRAVRDPGAFTAEALNKAAAALRKEIGRTAQRMGEKWEQFSSQTAGLFTIWRGRQRAFREGASAAVGNWLERFRSEWEHGLYHTGEMTFGGEFECVDCAQHMMLDNPNHLPPCPRCHKTVFRHI